MSARSGMAALIDTIRTMTNAGTAEYTLGTANFWDDDHVQAVLDNHRRDVYEQPLTPASHRVGGGTVQWNDYYAGQGDWEQTTGGTAVFIVRDSVGSVMASGTAQSQWTADYANGHITWGGTGTDGSAYYLTGRYYDLNGAAAELLKGWAAHESRSFDFAADAQQFKRSQKAQMLLSQATEYAAKAWNESGTMTRSDLQ